ncbi:hypothetical protein PT974_03466 [Cladobotryum mycophilum]|uniref:Uncharacterized protein n=1 Tax=Cladobotryum mycophilum TaxID=491253 RepID=A0ABR0SSI2_9HYPO
MRIWNFDRLGGIASDHFDINERLAAIHLDHPRIPLDEREGPWIRSLDNNVWRKRFVEIKRDASEPVSQSDHALDHVVKAKWHGRTFILEDIVAKLGNRGRSSFIKDHGIFVREILLTGKGDAFWESQILELRGYDKDNL